MAKGTQKVLGKGWLIRVRPNYYSMTPPGKAKAASLSGFTITSQKRNLLEYEAVAPHIKNTVFEKYCQNPEEPKTWLGASSFLGITRNDPDLLERNLNGINEAIQSALLWMDENKENILYRDDSSQPISRAQLTKLLEFIKVLQVRFKAQFDAIKSKRK